MPAVKPGGSGDLLPPSPPAEKANACQDRRDRIDAAQRTAIALVYERTRLSP